MLKWNSNTLATSCYKLTHLKRRWCWERLRAGGEGNDRGWDGWMASLIQWTWVWVDSGSRWWTGRPGMLCFMGSQRVRHDWVTKLNWMHAYHINCVYTQLLSYVQLFATLWTVARQDPLFVEFSRQEYWRGLPFLSPGDLSDLGMEPMSPALQVDSLPLRNEGSQKNTP